MSTTKSNKNNSKLPHKQVLEVSSARKSWHQFFTFYVVAIFLVVVVVLSAALWLLSQQFQFSQRLITAQLLPLQAQLLQQTYLINSNKLIDEIAHNANVNEIIILQQTLALQSKKLLFLKSAHKDYYQQWFYSNNEATNHVIRIAENYPRYQLLKDNLLIQLDTLLDAIKIELTNPQITSEEAALLTKVENQFSSIELMLKSLNLRTPVDAFEPLRNQINEMFVEDYGKQLANQRFESQDIVRDFIRFEDLIIKHGLLVKWQEQLQLMANYQQQLGAQQEQLQSILANSVERNLGTRSAAYTVTTALSPHWLLMIFAFTLSLVAGLLLLMRARMKVVSQVNTNFISCAIQTSQTSLITNKSIDVSERQKKIFYSAESEQLIKELQQVSATNYSEVEYLALTKKNKILEAKLVQEGTIQQKLTGALELIEFTALEKPETQIQVEHQRCHTLHLLAIKQLVLLGHSSIMPTISTFGENSTDTADNYLYQAYLEGRELVRQLKQASYYRYLQGSDVVLVLSDVNIAAQVQAVVLNLPEILFFLNNKVSLSIDEKILVGVHLDAELFSEMVRVVICLLLSKQTNKQLVLTLQLVDKNNGQQKIRFTGHVYNDEKGDAKIVQLPPVLNGFNDASAAMSELGNYGTTLLKYQHGDDISTQLTEQGYQLSFTLPVAIINNQTEQQYPVLSLPNHLVELEDTRVKLAAKYIAMPIAVLLAVKEPTQYQRLQQLLQAMGLQTTFVSCELMLQKHWQSGLFSVLLTELTCQPFIAVMADETEKSAELIALPRGVFSLSALAGLAKKPAEYEHWFVGELNANSDSNTVIAAMLPWIKERCFAPSSMAEHIVAPIPPAISFDFQRYLKHQGCAELAIFMLDEYTNENSELVMALSQAFANEDSQKAKTVIQTLLVNSKILAADILLSHCRHWLRLLSSQGLHNTDQEQINLLIKTETAVASISQHADVIV